MCYVLPSLSMINALPVDRFGLLQEVKKLEKPPIPQIFALATSFTYTHTYFSI